MVGKKGEVEEGMGEGNGISRVEQKAQMRAEEAERTALKSTGSRRRFSKRDRSMKASREGGPGSARGEEWIGRRGP
jgi:hypothetical protein